MMAFGVSYNLRTPEVPMSRSLMTIILVTLSLTLFACGTKAKKPVTVWGEDEVGNPDSEPIPEDLPR